MAKIIGNIKPEDDYTHPLGPEPNFNESVYFNFFDRTQNRGGFVRIGNRANEGYAEMTVIVWNPDGSALFNYAKPDIADNNGWNAGGLSIDILKPAERVRTRYEGKALLMANPKDMQDPSAAFKNNPRTSLLIDLECVSTAMPHQSWAIDQSKAGHWSLEQHPSTGSTRNQRSSHYCSACSLSPLTDV